jgi:membrane protein implicated in regulation of membrane protease activity
MRTLAIVTMIFLPGTFVAAVFSMPLFDWESNEHVLLPKFGIFWAVTIPLTLVTLLIYWIWSSWYARRNEHQVQRDAEAAKERGFELTPVSGRAWTDATFKTE